MNRRSFFSRIAGAVGLGCLVPKVAQPLTRESSPVWVTVDANGKTAIYGWNDRYDRGISLADIDALVQDGPHRHLFPQSHLNPHDHSRYFT